MTRRIRPKTRRVYFVRGFCPPCKLVFDKQLSSRSGSVPCPSCGRSIPITH